MVKVLAILLLASIGQGSWLSDEFELKGKVTRREPYIPQDYEFGIAMGNALSPSAYILGEGFVAMRLFRCGAYCFQYVEASAKAAALKGETNYIGTAGWRIQKYRDGSSWGPFFNVFVGQNHNIFSGGVQDTILGGVGIGTYYFLHPGADLRLEAAQAFGTVKWTFLTIGVAFKIQNL